MTENIDILIVGGGPAGLAAAKAVYDAGIKDVLVLERENRVGGILNQCIHNGFGLKTFKESLTGPEYASRYASAVKERGITVLTGTTVLSVDDKKEVTAINDKDGIFKVKAKAVIVATGCRERSRGALSVSGTRPAGVYSAGTAQKYVNEKGFLPGKEVVIVGSGDIGLIMARRMTLEGAKVKAVCEIMPYSSGLRRNIVQCLEDFDIPLYLSHTVTRIDGVERVTGVEVCKVDEKKNPVKGSEMYFDCDTVLYSVGLIPENEIIKQAGVELSNRTKGAVVDQTRQTSVEGIFSCGNALHVHDLVDFVCEEAEITGRAAAEYVFGGKKEKALIDCVTGRGISYILPQKIDKNQAEDVELYFRTDGVYKGVTVEVYSGSEKIASVKKVAVAPGEMQTLKLKSSVVSGLSDMVTVKIGD